MSKKESKVSILKTSPETVLKDYQDMMHLAEYDKIISHENETILKLNLIMDIILSGLFHTTMAA